METLILILAVGFLGWYLIRHPLKSLQGIGLVALWMVLGTIITGLFFVMLN